MTSPAAGRPTSPLCLAAALAAFLHIPASPAIAAAPAPEYLVRVHAVLVTGDQARAGIEVGEALLRQWVEQASGIFSPTGISFRCDYPGDVSVLRNESLLRLAIRLAGTTTCFDAPRSFGDTSELVREAARYPGRVVVFFAISPQRRSRSTTEVVQEVEVEKPVRTIKFGEETIVIKETETERHTTKYESKELDMPSEFVHAGPGPRFVVSANFSGAADSICAGRSVYQRMLGVALAHQLGMYLGLRHTFPRRFPRLELARQYLMARGGRADVFDGDGLSDTVPDPGADDFRCDRPGSAMMLGTARFEVSGNLLSHSLRWAGDGPELSPSQIVIVRGSVRQLALDVRYLSERELDSVIEREPRHPEAPYYRGRIRFAAGRYVDAGRDFAAVLGLRPSWHEALVLDGLAALGRFDVGRVRESLDAAVLAEPGCAVALTVRAILRRATGEPVLAELDFGAAKSACEHDGESWEGTEVLARRALWSEGMTQDEAFDTVCANLGVRSLAVRVRERIAAQEAAYAGAVAADARGDRTAAREACAKLLAVNPLHWMAWQLEGNLAHAAGERKRSVEAWRMSLALHPDNPGLRAFVDALDPAGKR